MRPALIAMVCSMSVMACAAEVGTGSEGDDQDRIQVDSTSANLGAFPPPFRDPCRLKRCRPGWHCTAPADRPFCVLDEPTCPGVNCPIDPCQSINCPVGTHCTAPADFPSCVPDADASCSTDDDCAGGLLCCRSCGAAPPDPESGLPDPCPMRCFTPIAGGCPLFP